MYYRIIGGTLIQLSDVQLEGYKEVIEHEKPQEQEGYYVAEIYQIIDEEVHLFYELRKKEESEYEEQ